MTEAEYRLYFSRCTPAEKLNELTHTYVHLMNLIQAAYSERAMQGERAAEILKDLENATSFVNWLTKDLAKALTGEAKPGKAKHVRYADREYRVWVVHGAGGPEETTTVRGLRAAFEAIRGSWDAEITDVETGEVIQT